VGGRREGGNEPQGRHDLSLGSQRGRADRRRTMETRDGEASWEGRSRSTNGCQRGEKTCYEFHAIAGKRRKKRKRVSRVADDESGAENREKIHGKEKADKEHVLDAAAEVRRRPQVFISNTTFLHENVLDHSYQQHAHGMGLKKGVGGERRWARKKPTNETISL